MWPLWVIICLTVVVIILVIFCFYYFGGEVETLPSKKDLAKPITPKIMVTFTEENTPILHSYCTENTCGGELVCDMVSHRCRKPEGSQCAGDVDCVSGLQCRNWRCVTADVLNTSTESEGEDVRKPSAKKVHWVEV